MSWLSGSPAVFLFPAKASVNSTVEKVRNRNFENYIWELRMYNFKWFKFIKVVI